MGSGSGCRHSDERGSRRPGPAAGWHRRPEDQAATCRRSRDCTEKRRTLRRVEDAAPIRAVYTEGAGVNVRHDPEIRRGQRDETERPVGAEPALEEFAEVSRDCRVRRAHGQASRAGGGAVSISWCVTPLSSGSALPRLMAEPGVSCKRGERPDRGPEIYRIGSPIRRLRLSEAVSEKADPAAGKQDREPERQRKRRADPYRGWWFTAPKDP